MDSFGWALALGLGMLWLGLQIVWVAPVPRQLRAKSPAGSAEKPAPAKGSPEAFGLFWLDQYAWIGLFLSASGLLFVLWAFAL